MRGSPLWGSAQQQYRVLDEDGSRKIESCSSCAISRVSLGVHARTHAARCHRHRRILHVKRVITKRRPVDADPEFVRPSVYSFDGFNDSIKEHFKPRVIERLPRVGCDTGGPPRAPRRQLPRLLASVGLQRLRRRMSCDRVSERASRFEMRLLNAYSTYSYRVRSCLRFIIGCHWM